MSFNGFAYDTVSHKYPLPHSLSQDCNTKTLSDSYVCFEETMFEQLKVSLSSYMTAGGETPVGSWRPNRQLSVIICAVLFEDFNKTA